MLAYKILFVLSQDKGTRNAIDKLFDSQLVLIKKVDFMKNGQLRISIWCY